MLKLLFLSTLLIGNAFATDCVHCSKKNAAPEIISNDALSDATKLTLKLLCNEPFDEAKWNKLSTNFDANDIKEDEVYLNLLRFAKPGGFKKEHLLYFTTITQRYANKYPKETRFALAQASLTKGLSYVGNIGTEIMDEAGHETIYNDEEACLTKEERENAREMAYQASYEHVKGYGLNEKLCDFPATVSSLMPFLVKNSEERQKSIINPIYRGGGLCLTELTEGTLFISKALVFTKNATLKRFGKKVQNITDVSQNGQNVIILSNKQINNIDKKTVGVYMNNVTPSNNKVEWETHGKKYSATIKSEQIKLKDYINPSPRPDYKKMWADKKLTGMTLVSDNLGDFKDKVTSNYIAYYVDQGYEFAEPVEVKDTAEWLKKSISSGEIDYVLKEAHSGGNDYDFIGLSAKHKIMTGIKKLPGGKQEVMHILMPQPADQSIRMPRKDMADWMKEREDKGQGPLLYVNSSCWSHKQAVGEIAEVKSKLFVEIPANTKTTTFSNTKNSTKYHIMEGIRKGQSYDEMEKGMSTTDRYKADYNKFVFPHQEKYHYVLESDKDIDKMTFELKDENGSPYALHEAME